MFHVYFYCVFWIFRVLLNYLPLTVFNLHIITFKLTMYRYKTDFLSLDVFGCRLLFFSFVSFPVINRSPGHSHADRGQIQDSWSRHQAVVFRHVCSGSAAHLWGVLQKAAEGAAGRQLRVRSSHRRLRCVDAVELELVFLYPNWNIANWWVLMQTIRE